MGRTGILLLACVVAMVLSCESEQPVPGASGPAASSSPQAAELIQKLAAKDRDEREKATDKLIEMGEPAVPALMDALRSEDADVRATAAWALAKIGNITDPKPFIDALKDRNVYVRINACLALANIPDKAVVGHLTEALEDKEALVRSTAAESLGYIAQAVDEPAVRALAGALRDEDWEVRVCAAWAFGEIRDPLAVQPLIGLLKDDDWRVREVAAESLGWICDPSAAAALIKVIKNEGNWNVRLCAIWSLGHIADESAIPVLIEALKDSNWRISAKAAKSLRKITGKDFGTDHAKWLDWWKR